MQRLGGGGYTRKRKQTAGGNDPSCGCDMQAGWPKSLTENIPMPSGQSGGGCGIPPIPNYYQGGMKQQGGSCASCSGLPTPTPFFQQQQGGSLVAQATTSNQRGGGNLAGYNSNPVPDACPFPGTGYCEFYARGGANYGEPMNLQAKLRGGARHINRSKKNKYVQQAALQEARRTAERLRAERAARAQAPQSAGPTQNVAASAPQHRAVQPPSTNGAIEQFGGGCGCNAWKGGYKPTRKNRAALKKWREGKSIGFTMTSSLKAKGLIPRSSRKHRGKKIVSAKYK